MEEKHVFDFIADLSKINISPDLNNPFGADIPEVVRIAVKEFQDFIAMDAGEWENDLLSHKGKMFGVLVVQKENGGYYYLGALSGSLPTDLKKAGKFIPSVFDDSIDDYFISRGMIELTAISNHIKNAESQIVAEELTESRKLKSFALQQRLFENYQFLNALGTEKNLLQIFKSSLHGNPPSAAGECAAPKLLHYSFKHQLKPIALAEFWWGKTSKSRDRMHKTFYPACKNRCRPILEFMLDDFELYNQANPNE